MRFIAAVFLVLFFLPAAGFAGDYMLTICNEPVHDGRVRNASWPVLTTNEIKSDINLFASGVDPQGIFRAAFTEGAVTYCSPGDRIVVRRYLVQALVTAKKQRVRPLLDFLTTSGRPSQAVSLIDSVLGRKDLSQQARARLLKARAGFAAAAGK